MPKEKAIHDIHGRSQESKIRGATEIFRGAWNQKMLVQSHERSSWSHISEHARFLFGSIIIPWHGTNFEKHWPKNCVKQKKRRDFFLVQRKREPKKKKKPVDLVPEFRDLIAG